RLMTSTNRTVQPAEDPYQRAVAVIDRVYYSSLPMKVRNKVDIIENLTSVPPAKVGGALVGTTAVTTTIDIYPPFSVGCIPNTQKVSLLSRHEVPITYVVPAQP